jgi:ferredoxin
MNETPKIKKAAVIWFSPSGNTGKVAGWFSQSLKITGYSVNEIDLSGMTAEQRNSVDTQSLVDCELLVLGSPVHNWHAAPILLDFVASLPLCNRGKAIIFCTYGAVTPGVALDEMDAVLFDRGFIIIGAAAILGTHSMMRGLSDPLAAGHPSVEDHGLIERLVAHVISKQKGFPVPEPRHHNISPSWVRFIAGTISPQTMGRFSPDIRRDAGQCSDCGECIEICPTANIEMIESTPHVGDDCIKCYNCSTVCPSGVYTSNLTGFAPLLRFFHRLPLGPVSTVIYD